MAYSALALTLASFAVVILKVPETPRYYFSKKQYAKCRETLIYMQKFNRVDQLQQFVFTNETKTDSQSEDEIQTSPLVLRDQNKDINGSAITPTNYGEREQSEDKDLKEAQDESRLKGNLRELFRIRIYARNLLCMIVVWSYGSFGFFLIPFYLDSINANLYVLAIAMGSAELFASGACAVITRFMTLKRALLLFLSISCFSALLLIFLNNSGTAVSATLILFLNSGVTSSFDVAYLINVELFPTIFLGTAYGACNIPGRFISILSPLFAILDHPYPMIIMVVFSGTSGVLSMLLRPIKKE